MLSIIYFNLQITLNLILGGYDMSINTIFQRRSIRKYTGEKVSKEQLNEILKAGMQSPSACNSQPWDFLVIDKEDLLNKITEFHPYSQMLKQASHAIIVCGVPEREVAPGYWPQDCAASTENMLLTITALGLGGVWLGVYPNEHLCESLRKIFNIPSSIVPFSIISLGYPNETREPENRYDEGKIHINMW